MLVITVVFVVPFPSIGVKAAMDAAEDAEDVKDKGYNASFPSITKLWHIY